MLPSPLVLVLATSLLTPPTPGSGGEAGAGTRPPPAAMRSPAGTAQHPSRAPRRPASAADTAGVWRWPLRPAPRVVHAFAAPAHPWAPGHRGVDLLGAPAQPVRAVAAGRVTHAGTVAGRGTVTVLHDDGVRSTIEPVAPRVRDGDRVSAGAVLGTLAPAPGHCAPATCLHLGALSGATYLDPLRLLSPPPVVLLPLGGR